ncbi:hypothetical protein COO60DRAFT_386325 [Scenedesmus sp. NREL 46B-D3]|nr:hypothetical protein COO60DRAFT_386325 [Scenedesmus sp. NREL 46B-D3]
MAITVSFQPHLIRLYQVQRRVAVRLQLGLQSRSPSARALLPEPQQQHPTASTTDHSISQSLPQPPATPAAAAAGAAAAASPLSGLSASCSSAAAPAAVSLDVEYAHMRLADGAEVSSPAWVALLDQHCAVLLKTYVKPEVPAGARCFGGVPPAAWAAAPALPEVVAALQLLAGGRLLLGHGLAKDLAALGMNHPQHLMCDTMTHPAFCNKAGNSRSLRQLAKAFLGLNIQQQQHPKQQQLKLPSHRQHQASTGKGRRQQQQQQALRRAQHDPEEDAAAVMRLYQQVVLPSTYEGQVAAATQQLLLQIKQRQQQQQQELQAEEG